MNVLEKIFEHKRSEVASAKVQISLKEIREQAENQDPTRGFKSALQNYNGLALIAEVKKASPSKGLIRPNFDPAEVAKAYERAGAQCLSVLTDERYFQGSPENLRIAKKSCNLPLLRKDFIDDPYQVYEARAWGADAFLLIVASLDQQQLIDLSKLGKELQMDVLVEVHNEQELETALEINANLIGVNNRNLADFTTSLTISETLIPQITKHALAVSESALETKQDLDRVQLAGAKAVLIGTSFCAAEDIEAKVHEVMGR